MCVILFTRPSPVWISVGSSPHLNTCGWCPEHLLIFMFTHYQISIPNLVVGGAQDSHMTHFNGAMMTNIAEEQQKQTKNNRAKDSALWNPTWHESTWRTKMNTEYSVLYKNYLRAGSPIGQHSFWVCWVKICDQLYQNLCSSSAKWQSWAYQSLYWWQVICCTLRSAVSVQWFFLFNKIISPLQRWYKQ